MADNDKKKYYWLKLKKDFFQRHDIRIIESMPNGKDYVLFYLKLMCESTSHQGELRFSEYVPYSEEMLATITGTNIDVVRQAIKMFEELKLIEILDDGTIFLNEVQKLIGSETGKAKRMRDYRERLKITNATSLPQCSLDIDIEKDIDIDIREKTKRFIPPTLEEIQTYINDKKLNVNANKFYQYFNEGNWIDSKGNKVKNWKQKLLTWDSKNKVPYEVDTSVPTYDNSKNKDISEEELNKLLSLRGK